MAKIINGRYVQKHDVEANWLKATGFIPLEGELIVYEADETCAYPRFKVGDGATNVNDLPFVESPTQADWNQNDTTAPDYVKNRTHWEEGVILPETEIFPQMQGYNPFMLTTPLNADMEIGKTYTFTIDGVAYDATARDGAEIDPDFEGTVAVDMMISSETGFSFAQLNPEQVAEAGFYAIFSVPDPSVESVTLSIVEKDAAIHKLAPKFLPDTVVMAEPSVQKQVIILPETELTYDETEDGFFLLTPWMVDLVAGGVYDVTYNGVKYECEGVPHTESGFPANPIALGNVGLMGLTGGNIDAPFAVVCFPNEGGAEMGVYAMLANTDDATSVTLSIERGEATPKQIVMDKDGNIKWENRTHWVEDGTYDILPEATYTDGAAIEAAMTTTPLSNSLVVGEVYQVYYNGTTYECTCIGVTEDGVTIPVLGNTDALDIPGGNTDAPFVFMEAPASVVAESGIYWQLMTLNDANAFPMTLNIKCNGEVVHKIDNKFLDIAQPDWNALPSDAGYIANRTHYCDNVGTITVNASILSGQRDKLVNDSLTATKLTDYYFDAATLKAATISTIDSSTGNKTSVNSGTPHDASGYTILVNSTIYIISVYDISLASASLNATIPSTGTYVTPLVEETIEIEVGEIVKKLDKKYIPDIEEVNSNLLNGISEGSLRSMNAETESDTYSLGRFAVALNHATRASGQSAFATGYSTIASGHHSRAGGSRSAALGDYSYASGYSTFASGEYSHAEGYNTKALGSSSYAVGHFTSAQRARQFVIGNNNRKEDIDRYVVQDGGNQLITASGNEYTKILTTPSINQSTGKFIFSETTIVDLKSLATGDLFVDYNSGSYYYEITSIIDNEDASRDIYVKYYKIKDTGTETGKFAFIIGNGINISTDVGSNAHAVDWNGNAYYAGDVYVQGNGITFEFDGKKKLATEEHVDNVVSGITYESIGAEKAGAADEALSEAKAYTDSKIPTPEDAIALMIEMGFVDPVVDETGALYTNGNTVFTY